MRLSVTQVKSGHRRRLALLGRREVNTRLTEPGGSPPQQGFPWLPILMYHRVVDRVDGSDPYHLKVSTAAFELQMQYLRDHGYQSLFLEDVALTATNGGLLWSKPVVITLDDGYRDTYVSAFPILRKYQMKATVLLVSGRIGSSNTWDVDKAETSPLLDLDEIGEMAEYDIKFGSHGVTHRSLLDLSPAEAWKEIVESKAALEHMLSSEVRTFCYPYGRTTPALGEMAKRAGYAAACGIEQREHTLFNLSRVDVASCGENGLLWRLKVSGMHYKLRQVLSLRKLKRFLRGENKYETL